MNLPDAKALFAHLMTRGPAEPLTTMQRLGARVASTQLEGDRATLTTMADERFTMRQDGERWALTLASDELDALEALVKKAEDNQRGAKANAQRLRGNEVP